MKNWKTQEVPSDVEHNTTL